MKIGIVLSRDIESLYITPAELKRLEELGDVAVEHHDVPSDWGNTPVIPELEDQFGAFVSDLDILLLCHGAPKVTDRIMAAAPRLRMIGELEGDRFAGRIDLAAANERGILVVDTTHSSSWPVSEWALALAMVGLREHGRFRDVMDGRAMSHDDYRTDPPARELTGKTVGLIGFGHIAWRLRELLVPFRTRVLAYDPYAPRELAEALDVDFTSLPIVMGCDVVVCLAPATPGTTGMIGVEELALLQSGAVFINVSRGVVVDTDALISKAAQNDAWFCLDAHDPEPIAVDSPLRQLRNVLLSPHLGGLSVEAGPRFFTLMVDEVDRYLHGLEPRAQITDRVVAGRQGTAR